ncbi:MAG: amino acid ABC transporter substrate-binding protein [Anaerolineae bacterium]|nr:amino acid ABC transporter substrate-binding protein [Anaerolineae bacterium]
MPIAKAVASGYNPSMRRWALVLIPILLVLVLGMAVSDRSRDHSLDLVRQRGTLRVGMDASFPPFEVVNAVGELEGLDVDLARLLAREMDLNLDIANIAFDGLYEALSCGEVDLLLSALPYDPLRTGDVRYSAPYFTDGLQWLYRVDSWAADPDAFEGEVLAEAGSEAARLARQNWPRARVTEVLSEQDVVLQLTEGAEAGIVTRVSACSFGLPHDGIAFGPLISEVPYSVVARAGDTAVAEAVADALDEVMASDDYRAAVVYWLGEGCWREPR